MASLTSSQRKRLPSSAFAYPRTRSFPIHDLKHARAALARAAQKKTAGSYATVAKAVRRKFGNKVSSVGRKRGVISRPGYKRTGRRK